MKTVLVIGPDFVPSSMPPALRVRFFVRHLPDFGWNPVVLTTDPACYEQPCDPANERLLPEGLEVIRTRAWPARITRKFGLGDLGLRSLWFHWKAVRHICQSRPIDLIFIPVPPSVSMVLGRLAYDRFAIPYVVDYIDPWVSEYYWSVPRAQRPPKWWLAYWMARLLEPFAIRRVAHITGVSQGTTDSVVRRYPRLTPAHATAIPYGGEPADFDYLRRHPRLNAFFHRDDGLVHVSYVGACIPAMHAALRALLTAARQGRSANPGLFARLRFHFIGTTYASGSAIAEQVMPIAREMGAADFVQEHPARVAYLDALQLLLDSDATVVLGSDEPHYTASKLFPYILAGKPLLAIFHQASSVIEILRQTNAGQVVAFSPQHPPAESVPDIEAWLAAILSRATPDRPATDWTAFEAYTTRAMAGKLAEAFDRALGARRPAAARAVAP